MVQWWEHSQVSPSWNPRPGVMKAIASAPNYQNNSLYLARKYIYVICQRTVSERSSRKPVSFEEQIWPKDKCPSIFSRQMEAIVFIILQIFVKTRAVLTLGNITQIFPSFSQGISSHMTRLDQSRTSENIWWIITRIFVRGHFPFGEVNCDLRGKDNVQGQFSEHILALNGGYCVKNLSNSFRNTRGFENWRISLTNGYISSSSWGIFSHVTHWGIFSHVTHQDQ